MVQFGVSGDDSEVKSLSDALGMSRILPLHKLCLAESVEPGTEMMQDSPYCLFRGSVPEDAAGDMIPSIKLGEKLRVTGIAVSGWKVHPNPNPSSSPDTNP